MAEKLIYTDRNGADFLVYYDYVSASLSEKDRYQRPAEPEPEKDEDDSGAVG